MEGDPLIAEALDDRFHDSMNRETHTGLARRHVLVVCDRVVVTAGGEEAKGEKNLQLNKNINGRGCSRARKPPLQVLAKLPAQPSHNVLRQTAPQLKQFIGHRKSIAVLAEFSFFLQLQPLHGKRKRHFSSLI